MKIEQLDEQERYDALNLIREDFFTHGNKGLSAPEAKVFLEALSAKGESYQYLGCYEAGLLEAVLAYDEEFRIFTIVSRNNRDKEREALFQQFLSVAEKQGMAVLRTAVFAVDLPSYEALGFEAVSNDGKYVELEYFGQKEWLGETVTVTVDRPYGSMHPHYPDTIYLCNYGYVEELLARDGEFQDAYVVGINEPLEKYTGIVIAIIYRRDDCESKWVVAGDINTAHQEVINAVGMVEQYFDTRIAWFEKNPSIS
jgi:hypothetical protein